MIKDFWDWKMAFIKKHPLLTAWLAFFEGVILTIIVYEFFL